MSPDRNVVAELLCFGCDPDGLVKSELIGVPAGHDHVFLHELDPPLDPPGLCPDCGGHLDRREVT